MVLVYRMFLIHLLVNVIRVLSDRHVIKVVSRRKIYELLSCILYLELDECLSQPCANNGTCVDLENGFLCHCLPEWNGTLCTEAKSRSNANLEQRMSVFNLVRSMSIITMWSIGEMYCYYSSADSLLLSMS